MKISFIVDGDKEFLSFAERHLTIFGYQVYSFTSPDEFLASLRLRPELIILGDQLGDRQIVLNSIRKARTTLSSAIIIQVAVPDDAINAASSIKAGASEFIERNSATFVRLRTSLDLREAKDKKGVGSIMSNLKKVFIG